MTSTPAAVRVPALVAPAFLFLYGVLRLIDGADGYHGPGLAWNLGHSFFFVAFALLGVLTAGLRHLIPPPIARTRLAANASAAASLFGIACFLWVILGDLFQDFTALPDALQLIGPLAFPSWAGSPC